MSACCARRYGSSKYCLFFQLPALKGQYLLLLSQSRTNCAGSYSSRPFVKIVVGRWRLEIVWKYTRYTEVCRGPEGKAAFHCLKHIYINKHKKKLTSSWIYTSKNDETKTFFLFEGSKGCSQNFPSSKYVSETLSIWNPDSFLWRDLSIR